MFLFLTVILSSLSYIPILRAGTISVQGGLFIFTMMWSPGLAALLTQLISTHSLRGLFVPELAKVTSFNKTALISGMVWAAWHMPAIFLADLNDFGTPHLYAAAMFAVLIVAINFPFAWLTLKSRSLWPAVLLHATHNQFILGILDKLIANTNATPYITGEFGIGLALTSLVVAYVFWRMQRSKTLQKQLIPTRPVVQPEKSDTI